ncbi:Clavaminate synthase-like protein [Flagelloscypha sp. PMI_526]|nr:Clavaminate synthase-like protein [Flagelloscypha sp. PMI_526]
MSSTSFDSVPVLDYRQAKDPLTKDAFLSSLRDALVNVGFLYLSNHPVDTAQLEAYIPRLFALPQSEKDKIAMKNSPHFLGYTAFGKEFTKGRRDSREQFDLATRHESRWREGDEDYKNLWGPSQWPDESLLPGFQDMYNTYLDAVSQLSMEFVVLLAQALGLEPQALLNFYDQPELMQHRSKIVQYPLIEEGDDDQGVGPHYDAGFLTFLLQASPHPGLQVQNLSGQWIDVPPLPGTFVVNIGKALEFSTSGLARATSHRVLSPRRKDHSGPRYSVPFFQNISLEARLLELKEGLKFPPATLALLESRGMVAKTESVNFTEFDSEPSGRVNLIGRVKSHPDVAKIHYPKLFQEIFPSGIPL